MKSAQIFAAVAFAFIVTACGQRVTGTYNLIQSGSMFTSPQCSQITLTINESGSQISGSGANACYNQMIQGTSSNGMMQVTLSLVPVSNTAGNQTGFTGSNSTPCTFQGTLTLSGNSVSGVLSPVSTYGYGCGGQIQITGTRN